MWSSAAVAHFLQGLMCCVFRDGILHSLGGNESLFELLLPSYHLKPVYPFSSDLSHQQGIFVHTTAAHWIFSLFRTIESILSVNPRDGCALKS